MIVGGKYMPGCALFAVPNLWVIVNTFRSFFIETINKIRKGIAMIINRENLSDRQELDRINFSNMNERVLLDNKDVRDSREYTYNRIGYISDNRSFYEMEDAFANEAYYSDFYNVWDGEIYRDMLNRFNVPTATALRKLSKGERVKFQLAFSAAYKPKVLLLDEPTAGLDPVFRDDFLKTLQELVALYETTILLATHLDEDLNKIADYIIDIENGHCKIREA